MGLQEFGIIRKKMTVEELEKELEDDVRRECPTIAFKTEFISCKAGEEVDFTYGDRHMLRDKLEALQKKGLILYDYTERINMAMYGTYFPSREEVEKYWKEISR